MHDVINFLGDALISNVVNDVISDIVDDVIDFVGDALISNIMNDVISDIVDSVIGNVFIGDAAIILVSDTFINCVAFTDVTAKKKNYETPLNSKRLF